MSTDTPRNLVSIIVPVWNEAARIERFLRQLHERARGAEVIVVDGESMDGTGGIARGLCHRLIFSKPGRGRQMNAGARAATGETFWFLHADTEVPANCLDEIATALWDPKTVGGFFRIQLPRDRLIYRLTDSVAHYAGKLLRIRCGDHGFFCRRDAFEKLGGFPNAPLMEDVEFFRAILRLGRMETIHSRLLLSPRRYEQIGPAKLTFAYGLIATLYALGVPLRMLAAIYQRACCAETAPAIAEPSSTTWDSRRSAGSRSLSS